MKEMMNIMGKTDKKATIEDPDGLVNVKQGTPGERDLQVWRRKLDDLKAKSKKKGEHLEGIRDRMFELDKEQKDLQKLSQKTGKAGDAQNPLKQIRILENRLDKGMMKFNEAMSIKKTYDIILKRLREERIAYEKQLEGLEQAIQQKSGDYNEMLLLSHDANHARDLAGQDLKNFENQL